MSRGLIFRGLILAMILLFVFSSQVLSDLDCRFIRGDWEFKQKSLDEEYHYIEFYYTHSDIDAKFSFKVLDNDFNQKMVACCIRAAMDGKGSWGGSYYYLRVYCGHTPGNNHLQLCRIHNGTDVLLDAILIPDLADSTEYKMRISATDDHLIRGKYWLATDPEPAWQVSATDSTIKAGDFCLVTYVTSAVFWDLELDPFFYANADKTKLIPVLLDQNFPNPFNPVTTIIYSVTEPNTKVVLNIYDASGRRIKQLVNLIRDEGNYVVNWDGTNNRGHKVASGMYFYQLISGNYKETKKMILSR